MKLIELIGGGGPYHDAKCSGDPAIAGIATDGAVETVLPVAHLDDIPAIAAMMQRFAIPVEDVLGAPHK